MPFYKEELLCALNWRYATKKFDPSKKVSQEDLNFLLETLRLSPSSFGLQPWKFIVIEDKALRQQLTPYSWNQTQVVDCSHFVVFTTLKEVSTQYIEHYIQSVAETRNQTPLSLAGLASAITNFTQNPPLSNTIEHWTARQSYIAMGTLMSAAAQLHIDTCPMEGLNPLEYDKILDLSSSPYKTVAAVALGYRHAEDSFQHLKKSRFDLKEIIEFR